MEHLYTHHYQSAIARLYVGVDRAGCVHHVSYADFRRSLTVPWEENKYACGEVEYQIDRYLTGASRIFSVRVVLHGTEFQRAVWARLQKLSYGTTMSYATLAQKIGRRDAVRAVANAVAANPVAIIVPCHRIIRSDGQIGSYARRSLPDAEGITIKHALLSTEGVRFPHAVSV